MNIPIMVMTDDTRKFLDERDMKWKSREELMQEIADEAGTSTVMRTFQTGATRDTDYGKHDPEAFLSPLVIERYNQFMHVNRQQKDGTMRDGDNWQKGIPLTAYAKSMWRHFLDFWKNHRGLHYSAREDIETALCAIMFNAMGYLHEILKKKEAKNATSNSMERDS